MTTITDHRITRLSRGRVTASARINLNGQSHRVSFIVPGESVYEGVEPFLKGQGKIEIMEQERRFRLQRAWARSLEEHPVWLNGQLAAANEWGHSLEKELLARAQKQNSPVLGYFFDFIDTLPAFTSLR